MPFSRIFEILRAAPGAALLLAAPAAPALGVPIELGEADRMIRLDGPWKLRAGDDIAWARPDHDDSGWREIRVPTGRRLRHEPASEMVWYRLTVSVQASADRRLALTLGKVESAYEVFAGGIRLGGVGAPPPSARAGGGRMLYDRHLTYVVPAHTVDEGGRLVLALRVWKSPSRGGDIGALYSGPFLLGNHEDLIRRELLSELPQLILAILTLLAGLFHLQLYRRRPELKEYLWFFLLTACAATYIFLRTQWKYALSDRFALMKELEYLMIYLLAALFIQLLWPLLGAQISKRLRLGQWLFLGLGVLVAATPGLELNARLHPLWMLGAAAAVAAGLREVVRGAWRRQLTGWIVVAGAVVSSGTYLVDMATHRGWILSPSLSPYGFGLLVLTMGLALADRFIRVFGELEVTAERERRAGAELRRAAEEREHFIVQREELITRLEERNAELDRFNQAISHDLKGPLLTIGNFAGYLRRDAEAGRTDRLQQDLARIEVAADHMGRMIKDLLEYSKAGHHARLAAVPFADLVRQASELLAGAIAERGVEIEVVSDLPVVFGDRIRLLQVVQNLLLNAVKYMGEQERPRVEIGAYHVDGPDGAGEDVIFFRDNGIGIDAGDQQRVFSLFQRVETGIDGSGIGLALVKRIVELHGGRTWVESDGRGHGSTFRLVLPTWQAEPSEPVHERRDV